MTNDKDKVIITENGWEIYEEDDDLINKELLTEDISGGLRRFIIYLCRHFDNNHGSCYSTTRR